MAKSIKLKNNIYLDGNSIKAEEGTWIPILDTREGIAPTVSYTVHRGSYKKIGNIIFFDFYIRAKITALNGTNNYAAISGLPYTARGIYLGEQGTNIGVLYSAVSEDNDCIFSFWNQKIHILKRYGAMAVPWKITDTSYMEIGGSGFYFIE